MALNLTNGAALVKSLWPEKRVQNLVYSDNPFLALVPKDTKFGGDGAYVPVIYGNPQGRSAAFATAQANKGNARSVRFYVTRAKDYSLFSVDNEAIDASEGDEAAVARLFDTEMGGAMNAIKRSAAVKLFRNGSGSIGRIATGGIASAVITLASPDDVTNFEVGMVLQVSATDGGGAGVRAGTVTVAGVDRDAGTVTCSGNVTAGIAAAAAGDYIFQQGDYDSAMKGLDAWLPSTAPTSTPFFGVDRSVDPTRLGGVRYDASSQPIEEGLVDAAHRVGREGGAPTHCLMNYKWYANLEKSLGSKVQYVDLKAPNVEIGFRGIKIAGPRGDILCIADQNCVADVAFMLTLSTWKLRSLGSLPKVLNSDGNQVLRETAADAIEGRIGYYANLTCNAPGWNARVKLA